MDQTNVPIKHAFSIDVEDWCQLTFPEREVSDYFEKNMEGILQTLSDTNTTATFFILGSTAEQAPGPIRKIAELGHEVQSHGYSHKFNFLMSEQELRDDLNHARQIIEDITGHRVDGYRAPMFTIDQRNLWALDVVAETGHVYDSSVFALKTGRYGIHGYPPGPQVLTLRNGQKMVEAPVACATWMGRRWPVGGGGYFRLWPYSVLKRAWRQLERVGRAGIVYMHPYEYDPTEMRRLRHRVPLKRRLHQGIGRSSFHVKVDRLLRDFRFGTMRQVLAEPLQQIGVDA